MKKLLTTFAILMTLATVLFAQETNTKCHSTDLTSCVKEHKQCDEAHTQVIKAHKQCNDAHCNCIDQCKTGEITCKECCGRHKQSIKAHKQCIKKLDDAKKTHKTCIEADKRCIKNCKAKEKSK
jgi:hypothetical protein